jgi:hypothetical protein
MAVVTLNDYKTWAGISGTGDDTRLQVLIDGAHAAARRFCGRSLSNGFESATRTEDYVSESGDLQLAEFPVTSITSITPIDENNNLGTAFDSTSYRLDASTGIVTLNASDNGRTFVDAFANTSELSDWSFRPRFRRVRVVYVSDAPAADVKIALFRMVDGLYASIRKDPSLASQSLGSWSVSYASPEAAASAQASLLNPFSSGSIL